jgi:hypothetical protein
MAKPFVSPSRVYVAMCNTSRFDGFYFYKFVLPEEYENDSEKAAWYFLNRLDFVACLENCFPVENLGYAGECVRWRRHDT